MNKPIMAIYILTLMFVCCIEHKPEQNRIAPQRKINTITKEMTLCIQPFDDLPEEYLEYVIKNLRKIYPRVSIQPPIKLPPTALNQSETQYRADSLLRFLRDYSYPIKYEHTTIGLTSKDVSVTRSPMSDYCIMGLAYRPGKACIASSYRLKQTNKVENFFKLTIHELGHTQGLRHCPNSICLMLATKKDHFNRLTDLCPKCKETLNKAGWTIK